MNEYLPQHVAWASQPYRKIQSVGSEDGSVLVVPVGSIEQHGHHLPVSTDTLLAKAIAGSGSKRAAVDDVPVLVTPTVWSGHSPHHRPFGGTLTIEGDQLVELLERVAASGLRQGFDAVLFLNGHGGNSSFVDSAVSSAGEASPEAEILGVTYFALAAPIIEEVRESDTGGMAHGGEFETSLMLHLYPDLVEMNRAEGTPFDEPYERAQQDMFEGGPLSVYRQFDVYSETGAIGNPELATDEKGAELFTHLGEEVAMLLKAIHLETR